MSPGRRRASGPGRREKQHKRSAATYSEKLAVVLHFEWSRDMPLTVKKFHPALDGDAARAKARLFYRWVQQKEIIAARADSAKTSRQSRVRPAGVATTLGADGERELVNWLREARRRGEQVATDQLRARALEIVRARGVPEGVFAGTSTWLKGFLDRHRAALQQDDSADAEAPEDEGALEDGGAAGGAEDGGGDADMTEDEVGEQAANAVDETLVETVAVDDGYDYEDPTHSATGDERSEHTSPEPVAKRPAPAPPSAAEPTPPPPAAAAAAANAREQGRKTPAPRRERATAPTPSSTAAVAPALQLSAVRVAGDADPPAPPRATPARRAVLLSPVAQHAASPAPAPAPAIVVSTSAKQVAPAAVAAAVAIQASSPAAVATTASPARAVVTPSDAEELEQAEREVRRRRAEIEERKAELLNESLRYDNVLKRIRVAEENALARKRLKDAGVAQEEIDALLPVLGGG